MSTMSTMSTISTVACRMKTVAMHSFVTFRPGKKIDSVKICKNCKFYLPNRERCQLFGNLDIVTGAVEYNFASSERNEQGECGPEATFWAPLINSKFITHESEPPAAPPAASQANTYQVQTIYPLLPSLKEAINKQDFLP